MEQNINNIVNLLIKYNEAYRNGTPLISDAEYDALEEQLRILEPHNDWFKKGVNDNTPKKRKVKLPFPMMSLNKYKTIDSLSSWLSNYPNATFIITPKYDGLSVGIKGNAAWTRGDGIIGQDCTKQLMYTQKPVVNDDIIIRGEIILNNKNWIKFKNNNSTAVSSRNSATGLINGDFDTNRIQDYKLLTIMPYEIVNSNIDKEQQLNILNSNVYHKVNKVDELTEEFLFNLFLSWKNDYPIDGLVIDVNESHFRNGTEANGNPSYCVAYKSPKFSESGIGIIKEIELNINRHGIVSPVAILEQPIYLSDVQINRVSAINMGFVTSWGILPGEQIQVVRSGDVIPKIISVGNISIPFKETYTKNIDYLNDYNTNMKKRNNLMLENNITLPDNLTICPHCGTKLEKLINDSGDWCEMYCPNNNCYKQIIESAIKFFEIVKMDGFGDKKITQIANYYLNSNNPIFFDILNIDKSYLLNLDGWAETSANSFINECNKIKTQLPFARFLHATGWFSELGEKTLQKIIDTDGFNLTIDELVKIDGVQTKTAVTFCYGRELYLIYKDYIHNNFKFTYFKTSDIVREGKLSGLNVCMTGFRDKMLASQISENGGNILDTFTKNVNCLITKDKNSTSSKISKAKKLGIEVLDINEFKSKYL